MKFKLDENIPVEASILFRESGHDAVTVLDQNMGGKADEHIIQICTQEQRALITLDLDFADIKAYPPSNFHGIFVLHKTAIKIKSAGSDYEVNSPLVIRIHRKATLDY